MVIRFRYTLETHWAELWYTKYGWTGCPCMLLANGRQGTVSCSTACSRLGLMNRNMYKPLPEPGPGASSQRAPVQLACLARGWSGCSLSAWPVWKLLRRRRRRIFTSKTLTKHPGGKQYTHAYTYINTYEHADMHHGHTHRHSHSHTHTHTLTHT